MASHILTRRAPSHHACGFHQVHEFACRRPLGRLYRSGSLPTGSGKVTDFFVPSSLYCSSPFSPSTSSSIEQNFRLPRTLRTTTSYQTSTKNPQAPFTRVGGIGLQSSGAWFGRWLSTRMPPISPNIPLVDSLDEHLCFSVDTIAQVPWFHCEPETIRLLNVRGNLTELPQIKL